MKHIYLAIVASFIAFSSIAQSVATFDDLVLDQEKFWNGSDESGSFTSGGIKFHNLYNTEWQSWSGFAYSNLTDIITAGYTNQYSAITGHGKDASANYAVCYSSSSAIAEFAENTDISGFYVTNSTYTYMSMKNGDTFSKKFGGESGDDPDFFKLTIEALDENGISIGTVDFYLADFRFTDNSKDYILNKWTWVDLKTLKNARKLVFSLSSSDNSYGFMNTPSYFCIDDLNGEKPFDYQSVTFASFENLNMGTQGYYNGSDKTGSFMSGNFRFFNEYNELYGSWSGFAASAKTDVITEGYGNQYSAITGKGVDGTSTYAVGYPAPVSKVIFKDTVVSGLYITNSTYAYWSMKNGDSYSKKFGGETGNDEDWFILTITGIDSNGQTTGKVESYLANFTSNNPQEDYILNTWKWVDLKTLGRISKIEFSLRSTDNGIFGMNTPAYFCIDYLNRQETTAAPVFQQFEVPVYPNPFQNQITVNGIQKSANVSISDISGRKILEYHGILNNQRIGGLDQLKVGIYIVEITEGTKRTSSRLVKK